MKIDPVLFTDTHGALPSSHYAPGAQKRAFNELPSVELIQQIVAEYGDFQNITEEGLEQKGKGEEEIVEEDELTVYIRDSVKERDAMLQHVHAAVNSANIASDLVSLVVSKIRPNAAQTTMSSLLKQHVKMGSLSYSVIPKPEEIDEDSAAEARREEVQNARLVGRGWKLQMLKKCSETLRQASEDTKHRIEVDRIYWKDMTEISCAGEVITLTSNKEMCVKYGFGDSGSVYYDKGVGLLKRGEDGHVVFDKIVNAERDVVWGGEHVCVLKLYKKDENGMHLVGESNTLEFLQKQLPQLYEEGEKTGARTVLDEIAKSRFALFENELYWHLIKEATGLISLNVEMIAGKGQEDTLEMDSTIRFRLPTVTAGELVVEISKAKIGDLMESPVEMAQNSRADELLLLLRLLLCDSHRRNLETRNSPPMAMSSQYKPAVHPRDKYGFLIRPIVMYARHNVAIAGVKSMLNQWGEPTVTKFAQDESFFHTISTNIAPESKGELNIRDDLSVAVGITSMYRTVDVTYHVEVTHAGQAIFTSTFSNKVEMEECISWVLKPYLS